MSFIVEDGTGLSTATSYVSVADANTYFTDRSNATWTGSDAVKEVALIKATQYVEAKYDGKFIGVKATSTQALNWPRINAEDANAHLLSSSIVPARLKDAVCELAVKALSEDLLADVTSPGAIKEKSVTIGPVSKSVKFSGTGSQQKKYAMADLLLRSLLARGAGVGLIRRA